MELQSSESKKLFKVFDGAKRKRVQKKRDGPDDSNSVATDDSNCVSIPVKLLTSIIICLVDLSDLHLILFCPPESMNGNT